MRRNFFGRSIAFILGILLVLVITNPNKAEADTNDPELSTFVRNTMSENHMRGSVAVIKNGHINEISYGYAWYGKKIGNSDARVIYPTGSLQKVITGAIIVQLINENLSTEQKFSQYTKISRWYPTLKNAKKISLGNLLTHTSGITATGTEDNRGKNCSENQAINWCIDNVNNSSSGKIGDYNYNNTNYILLAGIIRKITGKSYANNLQTRIIDKLGLKSTYLYQNIPKTKTIATSYLFSGGKNYQHPQRIKKSLVSQIVGAGNLFSTPKEYYQIQVGLSDGRILDSADFNYLTHLKTKAKNYSGGLYIKKNNTLKLAYGNLRKMHFGSWMQLTTDNQNGIVMFLNETNDQENDEKDVGYKILEHIKPGTFSSR